MGNSTLKNPIPFALCEELQQDEQVGTCQRRVHNRGEQQVKFKSAL